MTVAELATIELAESYTWDSPDVRAFFQTLAVEQAECSGYPLRFFEDISNPKTFYLITRWKSVPAHYEWITGEKNKALLGRAKDLLKVVGLEHAELDSEVANGEYVVWKKWEAQEGQTYDTKATGKVLEARGVGKGPEGKEMVSSLEIYAEKEAAVGASENGKFKVMHKVVVS